jgi:hypothetical protein
MSRAPLVDIKTIAAMLAARAEQLCAEILPTGRRDGLEWRVGSVAGEPGQSLGVHLRGPKAGVWKDFASGDPRHQGDALDLVAMVLFGGDKAEALRWSRRFLGLDTGGADFRIVQATRPESVQRAERDAEGKRQKALALYLAGTPLDGTDPASLYLATRGLALAQFPRIPRALRFVPACWCAEVSRPLPAMVAAIMRRGRHVATHRTYLAQQRGVWGKAPLNAPKKVLGQFSGGFIPLWRGASNRPIAEAVSGEVTAIAEGIEDALTIALHEPQMRVLAAVSIGNFADIVLPEACDDVLLVFDRDGENPQARQARIKAVRVLMEQGRSVREARPPEGFKDFNAWHQAEVRAQQGRGAA